MSETIRVRVNGEERPLPAGTTVTGLLALLGLREDLVAVEVDREIVRRKNFAARALADGETIEVVEFVGGG